MRAVWPAEDLLASTGKNIYKDAKGNENAVKRSNSAKLSPILERARNATGL